MCMLVKTRLHRGSDSAGLDFILLNTNCIFSMRAIYFSMITIKIIYPDGFGQSFLRMVSRSTRLGLWLSVVSATRLERDFEILA